MNRYCTAPLQGDLQSNLNLDETQIGAIMTWFYFPYCLGCIVFGILGDRVSRKRLMQLDLFMEAIGLVFLATAGSFTLFSVGRFIIGLFQASFISISPTVIADMYTDDSKRTTMTGIFATGPAFGVALAFLSGPLVSKLLDYTLVFYVDAVLSIFAVLLMQIIPEYTRGSGTSNEEMNEDSETKGLKQDNTTPGSQQNASNNGASSVLADIIHNFTNKTFILTCFAFAMTSGVTEVGMSFFNELARRQFVIANEQEACMKDFYLQGNFTDYTCKTIKSKLQNTSAGINCESCGAPWISTILGGISVVGGISGTIIGMILYNKFYNIIPRKMSGAITSGVGCSLCATVILIMSFLKDDASQAITWTCAVLMFSFISLNFGVLTDVNNKVVVPWRRSLSNSMQNFIGRIIGGTIPPILAGYISENYQSITMNEELSDDAISMKSFMTVSEIYQKIRFDGAMESVLFCAYCGFLSGLLWFLAGIFWAGDEKKREEEEASKH